MASPQKNALLWHFLDNKDLMPTRLNADVSKAQSWRMVRSNFATNVPVGAASGANLSPSGRRAHDSLKGVFWPG
jgi:hypothetical protein